MNIAKWYLFFVCVATGMIFGMCMLVGFLQDRTPTYKDFILEGQEAVQTFLNEQAIPDPNGCGRPLVLTVDGVIGRDTSAAWSLYRANEHYADN